MDKHFPIGTERLLLRPFTEGDLPDVLKIFGDEEINRFLPWFPLKDMAEAEAFWRERYAPGLPGIRYAICGKKEGVPVGYVNLSAEPPYDLGYGLLKEFWGRGIVTEAARAVVEQARQEGLPYLTATHDRENPGSGGVMWKLGMVYQYSYEEQWQPKDIRVVFRLYQMDLDGQERSYRGYWDRNPVHFVEPGLGKE